MAFSDARSNVPEPQVRLHRDQASADQTGALIATAFGQIGGAVRSGAVRGGLEKDLAESGNIIATLNSPDTITTEQPDGSVAVDLTRSDPTGTIDTTSDAYQRIAAGIDQGKISQQRGAIEAEVILRQSIARAPGFADQLRQLAKDTLGFNASGAVLENLFLSGPDATTVTQADKDMAEAQARVQNGLAPTVNSAMRQIVGSRAAADQKAIDNWEMSQGSMAAPKVAQAAGSHAQGLMNSVMLQGFAQIRQNGAVLDIERFRSGLMSSALATIQETHSYMASSENNVYDQAAYDNVVESVNRIRDANIALLDNEDIMKVFTRRQDLVEAAMSLEAFSIAPGLSILAQFGDRVVEDALDFFVQSKGDPRLMEEMVIRDPSYKLVADVLIRADTIVPALEAINRGNLAEGITSDAIDSNTGKAILKVKAQQHINGNGNPDEFQEVLGSLADLELDNLSLSMAANTKNSYKKANEKNRADVTRQFRTGQQFVISDVTNALTGTNWALGWNPDKGEFIVEDRRRRDPTAFKTFSDEFTGGNPSQFAGVGVTQAAERAGIDSTPVLGSNVNPAGIATDALNVLNNQYLPLMRDPRWRADFGELDPQEWANAIIETSNLSAVEAELDAAGAGGLTGADVGNATLAQQAQLRRALNDGNTGEVFNMLKDMGFGEFNESASDIGPKLTRLEPGLFEDDRGRLIRVGPDGTFTDTNSLAADRGQITGETRGPKINPKASEKIVLRATEVARDVGIDENLFLALIQQESNFDPDAVSSAGAKGLTQLMDGTAGDLGVKDSFDPEQNLIGGADFLKKQLDDFGSVRLALAAYNAGPAAVRKAKGNLNRLPKETQDYVKRVMENAGL